MWYFIQNRALNEDVGKCVHHRPLLQLVQKHWASKWKKKKTVIHFTNVSHDLDEGKTLINNDKKNKSSKVTDVAIMQQEEEMLLKGH